MKLRTRIVLTASLLLAVAAPSTVAAVTSSFTVTSTLDGKTVLPLRIHWIASPRSAPGKIVAVDYSIDGRRAWTEHHAAYYYGGNEGNYGNWLVTSFLAAGEHTFTVTAHASTGAVAIDTIKARVVAAPAPPPKLAGKWTRIVTAADLKKGPKGPPAGRWTITVDSIGWATGPGDHFDVRYLASGNIVMGPEVDTPAKQAGGFCGIDPLHTWTVSLSPDDRTVVLNPVGHDACGDRVAVMQGTWTRSGGRPQEGSR
jgi:hypothetical protein